MARKSGSFAQFFYRVNPDQTTDSICGYCFLTVATGDSRANFHLLESAHHCRNALNSQPGPSQSASGGSQM
jgi:hypothetical protein